MKIILVKNEKLYKYPFPSNNITSYWIKDFDENSNERNLISIDKVNDAWYLFSNENCYIEISGKKEKEAKLEANVFYAIKILSNSDTVESAFVYICEENDKSFKTYAVTQNGEYRIGKDPSRNIILNEEHVSFNHASLIKTDNYFEIKAIDTCAVYVNNNKITDKILESGDQIFIFGYRIIILEDYILINGDFKINSDFIVLKDLPENDVKLLETTDDDNATIYSENDYFSRQPRFITSIDEEQISIDNPPGKVAPDETPLFLTLGPMITMTMTSAISVSSSVVNLMNGNASFLSALPTLLLAVIMIVSVILWPTITRRYNKKRQLKQEEERQKKYKEYLEEKRTKISILRNNQYQALIERYPSAFDLQTIILNKKRNLWERQISSDDFLNVRLGLGNVPLKVKVTYGSEDFTMVEDNLKNELKTLADATKDIPSSPVTIDLTKRNKLVLIGDKKNRDSMLKNIILQLSTYHAYNDLKLVFMIGDTTDEMWENFKTLPHTWSDSKDIRFFSNNYDEMMKLSFYLEQVYTARKYSDDDGKQVENNIDFRSVRPYYLIVVDNIKKHKNIDIIDKVLKDNNNLGFGLIILNDGISNLPNECNDFLTADGANSAIITSDLNVDNQIKFQMDNIEGINLGLLCEKLSNIPIKSTQVLDELKSSFGFLEMYKVGKVEDLNILDRWKNNDIINSLSVPIGIKSDGEIFTLDLHEKFHGPHGLIAGMTGSGKSEFIITYMLSMAVNYSPEEVSFVLIDYKGGGLTGAFENKFTGVKLPHLAGTITNLDTAEINRSLASIQSELKRRQEIFNEVKLKLNESTLDIYKYQQLYRAGLVKEPISHLFIISDEFAELKSQQPEFMSELISTARIGRSLGVHLILATQKPSGIVDDQIWSNSKFKVCLKVQEKSDSMDVIKRPDAVTLKKAGRFYLQVGYNDYFAIGQAAYAGTKYIPKDKITKTVDRDISFINNIGDVVKSVETEKRTETVNLGEELQNVLKAICDIAKSQNMKARELWLEKLEPEIFVNNLMIKYNFQANPWDITAIIGEYDDPSNQKQGLLTLDFNNNGNTLIYGIGGSEIMLSSIIYSLMIKHTSDELNMYIIDFGSEMFATFVNAPQIGDVVFVNEEEKLINLFNSLNKEVERRKKLFANYNGNYNLYIKNSGSKLPRIIIFINNYETFTETYEDYADIVSVLSRDGEKYGISFVITATGVNAVRGKTSQNFNNQICLQFNDPSDYMNIIGSTHGMVPSEIEGRGLVKLDGNIYEFQTAYPYKWDHIIEFIKNICDQLVERVNRKAKKIAVLPEHVRLSDIEGYINTIKDVPIGIEKNTLEISKFDFSRYPISLVSAQDTSILDTFVLSLAEVISKCNNTDMYFVDANQMLNDTSIFENVFNSDFKNVYNKILDLIEGDSNKTNVFVINGIGSFMSAFDSEQVRKVKSLFSNLKNQKNIRVVFADSIIKIKELEYEDFYKNTVQPINAIWVGSGITDQYTIKCSTYNKETRAQIPNDFGYKVDRGNAIQIKVLDFYKKD